MLFYPGTDTVFPAESYGLQGPFASLRLKLWRRGIQDVDYLTLAATVNPTRTRQIVERMVPKVPSCLVHLPLVVAQWRQPW